MFHPLYNDDGSISKVRVSCLLILAICLFLYGILDILSSPSTNERSQEGEREEEQAKALSVDENLDKKVLKHREIAIIELLDNVQRQNTSKIFENSYQENLVSFSDAVTKYYNNNSKIKKNSYTLELDAIGSQKQDTRCSKLVVTSKGKYYSFDEKGKRTLDCFSKDIVEKYKLKREKLTQEVEASVEQLITSEDTQD